MRVNPKLLLVVRVLMGWFFLYAGLSKVLNPEWTAAGFLSNAQTFPAVYGWFASSANIGWVDFANSWGQTLIGLGLITGTFVQVASWAGILMMVLYYFPSLNFPYAGDHALLVDDHVLYILILVGLMQTKAGHFWGLDALIFKGAKKKKKK
ncbi:hypothetical protein COY32_03385 [candidate division WWE3 bacterium CG_4_10_14_0_2_um_filter_41_14]|uniref:DoxX family protein n=1 Tax=candidate division WWE3 bacterium CG_4_10_14_0_2_um_filter_41_14 TaxID=1975072 RepID=A0A2M7TIZ4_UNCKA|nr:MAG: hypothetical protein COY32_03385 [candidate division WWE3 bacterium CG_4_10_14_0_2_um_filter_41_14]